MRCLPKRSTEKSVSEPRSLAKAIVRPSGDHCGCASPCMSRKSARAPLPSRFTTHRSVRPPDSPENTMRWLSGENAGLSTWSTGGSMRRITRRRATSMTYSTSLPPRCPVKAISLPSWENDGCE